MPSSVQGPRAQEKLDIILGQVTGLRSRLNRLALQHAFYLTVAIALAATAIIFAAASVLPPLQFLIVAAGTGLVGLCSLWLALRSAWRRHTNAVRAAELADERAGLKGRLTTIVETLAAPKRGTLWAYLIEDALDHRDEFIPRRIERRRIASSWWTPIAALALAAALIPLMRFHRPMKTASGGGQADFTVDLDDLHLRQAEPGDSNGLEVQADPATMARLREKLAREGSPAQQGEGGKLGGLLDRARNLADNMQRKLRGDTTQQKQRLTLRLADKDAGLDPTNPRGSDSWRHSHHGDQAGQFKHENDPSEGDTPLPPIDKSLHEPEAQLPAGESAEGGQELGGHGNSAAGADDAKARADADQQIRGEQSNNGGSFHGVGADPDSLFGEASKSKMSAEGFEIAIEARQLDRGPKGAGQTYLPPKVHTPLNAHQQPDEPIARAAVPAEDRTTIQRVFER
jgi:hypothetical protein